MSRPDPLAEERAAYLAASRASVDASLDARHEEAEQGAVTLETLHVMVGWQVEVLAAHDRFVQRAAELGLDEEAVSRLREGRANLALTLQRTQAEIDRRAQ